jgi:S-adenosylmethionine:diacylglycerol 3-amino-3-carboxypropyl transferase
LKFLGLEPDPDRARVAGYVIGTHGRVKEGTAQHLPEEPCPVDAVLFLDVGHYLSDPDMDRLLEDLHRRLVTGGPLVMRITIRTDRSHPWKRFKEDVRTRFSRFPQFLRTPDQITEQLARHGFHVRMIEDEGRDVCWFVAIPMPGPEGQAT